ncbi:T9SS type A sorting domain-containing protein [Algibacter mikhailovii]|uniref:T9SS type A sorting domain-containing protein n=1 Tax=Algibacter mikhailovii TaxID=425498 RepID=UPI002494DD33|nr:T9SS type A sorting domain-containing protein [Algibacter mikhailovii]
MKISLKLVLIFTVLISTLQLKAQTIKASSFGYNKNDATNAFREAIEANYDTIIIDKQAADWKVKPNKFYNIKNKVIIFEPGVVLRALPNEFQDIHSSLFWHVNPENLTIIGYGAQFIMNKYELDQIGTVHSEARHAISIKSGKNISIKGLTVKDACGDGIYINGSGVNNAASYSQNIFVEDVKVINAFRDGISLISVENFYAKNCIFTETKGTLPEAALVIEPNHLFDRIVNVNFENCSFTNNNHSGIQLSPQHLDGSSIPLSINFKDCYLSNNHVSTNRYPSTEIQLGACINWRNPVKGSINFERVLVENSQWRAVYSKKGSEAYRASFKDCVFKDITQDPTSRYNTPIYLETAGDGNGSNRDHYIGGFDFDNVLISYTSDRPFIHAGYYKGKGVEDITGSFKVINPNQNIGPEYVGSSKDIDVDLLYDFSSSPLSSIVSFIEKNNSAYEAGGTPIEFQVNRTGVTEFPLAVSYNVNGNAISGDDFGLLSGKIIIPAGFSNTSKSILARKDGIFENVEDFSLSLLSSSHYSIGSPNTLNLQIYDEGASDIGTSIDDLKISNLNEKVSGYNGNDNGDFEISANASTVGFLDSGWYKATISQSITEESYLEFEFKVNPENSGRIVGIGFDTNDELKYSDFAHFFQLAGSYIYDPTDERGAPINDFYTAESKIASTFADGWVKYSIPIGQYFTGNFDFLTFAASGEGQETFFRNINILDSKDVEQRQDDELDISSNTERVSVYSGYSNGDYEIDESGQSILLTKSGWHKATISQIITENTYLEFEFKVNPENAGRIVGIGFDTNDELRYSDFPQFFQLAGSYIYDTTDERGYPIYDFYTSDNEIASTFVDGWVKYSIHVGKYFSGDFDFLTFAATGDGQETSFRNIQIKDYVDDNQRQDYELDISNKTEQVSIYSEYGSGGDYEIDASGQSIRLYNSGWHKATISDQIGENTHLEFEFKVSEENLGRIVGIGFDTDDDLKYSDFPQFFQLAGSYIYDTTDERGYPIYDFYTADDDISATFSDGWVSYSIHVGKYFTGNFSFLTFGTTGDNQEAFFRNIKLVDYDDIDIRGDDELYISSITEQVTSYSVEDNGGFEIQENGQAIRLFKEAWKKATISQIVTEDTHLEFEFKVTPENLGRVVGIGFDTNNQLYYSDLPQFFQLAGSYIYDSNDNTEDPIYDFYTSTSDIATTFEDGWVSYSIHVGKYFTGNFDFLTFGASGENQEAFFRNIVIRDFKEVIIRQDDELDISNSFEQVSVYSNYDEGGFDIDESGQSVRFFNNGWHKASISEHTVVQNTYLEFEFKVNPENLGRIVGIGFDTNNDVKYSDLPQFFQLAGSYIYDSNDNIEDPIYDFYTSDSDIASTFSNGWVSYSIPVGQYFTGNFDFLTFGTLGQDQEAYFRNIRIMNKFNSSNQENNYISEAPLVDGQDVNDETVLFPNPTVNSVTILSGAGEKTISVFSYSGQLLQSVKVIDRETRLDLSEFPSGIYLVQVMDKSRINNFRVVKK